MQETIFTNTFTVSATKGWQDSGFVISEYKNKEAVVAITIKAKEGSAWSINKNYSDKNLGADKGTVDPDGKFVGTNNYFSKWFTSNLPYNGPNTQVGQLLYKIGSQGKVYPLGSNVLTLDANFDAYKDNDTLWFRINDNDSGLGDNTGEIEVIFEVSSQESEDAKNKRLTNEKIAGKANEIEELTQALKAKEEEITQVSQEKDEQCAEFLKAKEEELSQALKTKEEELAQALKDKDDQLQQALNAKEEELSQALKDKDTALEEALKVKDAEITRYTQENEQLQQALKDKEEEITQVSREKDEQCAESLKTKEEELAQALKDKDDQLQQELIKRDEALSECLKLSQVKEKPKEEPQTLPKQKSAVNTKLFRVHANKPWQDSKFTVCGWDNNGIGGTLLKATVKAKAGATWYYRKNDKTALVNMDGSTSRPKLPFNPSTPEDKFNVAALLFRLGNTGKPQQLGTKTITINRDIKGGDGLNFNPNTTDNKLTFQFRINDQDKYLFDNTGYVDIEFTVEEISAVK